jgi:hypothetical protein
MGLKNPKAQKLTVLRQPVNAQGLQNQQRLKLR